MGIWCASESRSLRQDVSAALRLAAHTRTLAVLDVGGGLNPWLGDVVTHVMDIDSRDSVVAFAGDMCLEETWRHIPDKHFDFISCTHTLEDIRDPGFVIAQMSRVGRSGFIAVPNRHVECTSAESEFYLGYGHHRWIFHIPAGDQLKAVAKFPAVAHRQYGIPRRLVPARLLRSRFGRYISPGPKRDWLNDKLARDCELGIIWQGSVPFSYANADYPGRNIQELRLNVENFLGTPFLEKSWDESSMKAFVTSLITQGTN